MGQVSDRILVLHDGDRIGRAVCAALEAAGSTLVTTDGATPPDTLVQRAVGCRALVAVGDRWATEPAVLRAAEMPGVRRLVLVVRGAPDLGPLRRRGAPYTVLAVGALIEEVLDALAPALASGRLRLDARADPEVAPLAAADAAGCAIAAVDNPDACGRTLRVAGRERVRLSALGRRVAAALGRPLRVAVRPRWVSAALRALGQRPFQLPDGLAAVDGADEVAWLHPGPWRTPEEVAAARVHEASNPRTEVA